MASGGDNPAAQANNIPGHPSILNNGESEIEEGREPLGNLAASNTKEASSLLESTRCQPDAGPGADWGDRFSPQT